METLQKVRIAYCSVYCRWCNGTYYGRILRRGSYMHPASYAKAIPEKYKYDFSVQHTTLSGELHDPHLVYVQWFVMLCTYLRVQDSAFLQQVLRLALISWKCALFFSRFFFLSIFTIFYLNRLAFIFVLRFELQMERQRDFYLLPRL